MQNPQFVKNTFAAIARRYDLANHLLSGGIDFFWRRRAAQIVREWQPRRVLDLATGSGDLALTIQRACPDALVTGADFCEPMLEIARRKGLQNVVLADAMRLPFAEKSFDVVTVAFGLRNMESWPLALREMARVLDTNGSHEKSGHVLILDFSLPQNALLRAPYRFYLHKILPSLAAALTREKSAYEYLADSIEQFPRGEKMTRLMSENGFTETTCEPLTGGIVSLYTGRRARLK